MAVITGSELRAVLGVGAAVSDAVLDQVAAAAEGALIPYLRVNDSAGDPIDYAEVPSVKECCLAAAVELWKTRTAPGGTYNAVDFTPSPFALGRSFFERFEGPMASWLSMKGTIG